MIKTNVNCSNISFRAYHSSELEDTKHNTLGQLNHYSTFFRYDNRHYNHADQFLVNLMREKAKYEPVNIVSVGCSFGEEAYSFAMGLEKQKNNVNISAFDVSNLAINEAKNGIYSLDDVEYNYFFSNLSGDSLCFRKEMSDSFTRNFKHLNANTFQLRDNCLDNCKFFNADMKQISRFFQPNSQDLLLCRYVLYHLTPQEARVALQQMYEILKPGGYLALNQDECRTYRSILKKNGFKPCILKPWLFQKPQKCSSVIADLMRGLVKKPDFDNIE